MSVPPQPPFPPQGPDNGPQEHREPQGYSEPQPAFNGDSAPHGYGAPQEPRYNAPGGYGQPGHNAPGGYGQPGYAQPPGPHFANENDKVFSVLAHILSVFTGFLAPLIIFLIVKDKPGLARENSRQALNFALSILIYTVIITLAVTILTFVTGGVLGFLLILTYVPSVVALVFNVIGTIKCVQDGVYRYPLSFNMVK